MNSLIGIESGGSNGSFGTHCGGRKTIVILLLVPQEMCPCNHGIQQLKEKDRDEKSS